MDLKREGAGTEADGDIGSATNPVDVLGLREVVDMECLIVSSLTAFMCRQNQCKCDDGVSYTHRY